MIDLGKHLRFIIWGAWYGSGNLGDKALLLAIMDIINKVLQFNTSFIIPTAKPEIIEQYLGDKKLSNSFPIHSRYGLFDFISSFSNTDFFIFGGGVPFYDDFLHTISIAFICVLSILFRVPVILWSVSSQKINSSFTKWVLRILVSRCSVMTCRDLKTLELLKDCGANPQKISIAPDPVFAMEFDEDTIGEQLLLRAGYNLSHPKKELVALTPRTFRVHDGEAHTHYKPQDQSSQEKQIETYAAVLDWAVENGYQPIFVPMNTVGLDDDRIAARIIIEKAKYGSEALLIDENIDPRVIQGIYKHCKTGLVTRVHGAITSCISGCPVVMYAFDQKHFGIMQMLKMDKWIFDPITQKPQEVIQLFDGIQSDYSSIHEQMQINVAVLKLNATSPIDQLLKNK